MKRGLDFFQYFCICMHIYAKNGRFEGKKSQDFVKISRRIVEKSQGFVLTRSWFVKIRVGMGRISCAGLRFWFVKKNAWLGVWSHANLYVSRKSIESEKIKFKNRFKDFQDLRELTNIRVMHELRCACVSHANLGGSKESLTQNPQNSQSCTSLCSCVPSGW